MEFLFSYTGNQAFFWTNQKCDYNIILQLVPCDYHWLDVCSDQPNKCTDSGCYSCLLFAGSVHIDFSRFVPRAEKYKLTMCGEKSGNNWFKNEITLYNKSVTFFPIFFVRTKALMSYSAIQWCNLIAGQPQTIAHLLKCIIGNFTKNLMNR